MKHFVLLVFSFLSLSLSAQNWTEDFIEGDELKGTSNSIVYTYEIPEIGSFIYWSNYENQFRLIANDGFFKGETRNGYYGTIITIGLYSSSNELLEKLEFWVQGSLENLEQLDAYPTQKERKKRIIKVMNHLLESDGYVRIIAPLYRGGDFDLKVPCRK